MKKNLKAKSFMAALGLMVAMSGSKMAKADLVDETSEWTVTGAPTYIEITEAENIEHQKDNDAALEAGEKTPAPQDAGAVITDVTATPMPTLPPSQWEDYEPTEEDTHPEENLPDEIERKDPTPTPTQPIPKMGDQSNNNTPGGNGLAAVGAGVAGFGIFASIRKIIAARKAYKIEKNIKSR
jgi:hypothetical protein